MRKGTERRPSARERNRRSILDAAQAVLREDPDASLDMSIGQRRLINGQEKSVGGLGYYRYRDIVITVEPKRAALKATVKNQDAPIEERFKASLKLAELPRNSAKVRIRNRCEVSGRPRGYYRKLKMSRIALRQLGNLGQIPGLVKSSW